jgi:thiol:disulfide interchange protein
MRTVSRILTAALCLGALVACNQPTEAPETAVAAPEGRAAVGSGATPAADAPLRVEAAVDAPTARVGHTAPGEGSVAWVALEEGAALASAQNKPIMVFVYTDWCPRCSELEPVFQDPTLVEAMSGLVTVRHNQDSGSAWLRTQAGDTDEYVPRVLFLNPDGSRMPIVSPHPRYPLFYTPAMREALANNMRQAQGS